MINFGIKITIFVEKRLNNGAKMALFRLSYLKVMWKDISQFVSTILLSKFLPVDSYLHKFLIDFRSDSSESYFNDPSYKNLTDR